jgi:FKBP-type peptidyl-prolyl cis-trans isomerase
MNTKTIATAILVVGLTAFLFLSTNSMANNRYQPSDSDSSSGNSSFESRLKSSPQDNLPTSTETLNELKTEVLLEGNTEDTRTVKEGDSITVNYVGWLASNGEVFDQSFSRGDSGFTFTVGSGVIEGWSQGVVGMEIGEVRRLMIPAALAYGSSDNGPIPANSDLYFDVELIAIN